MELAFKSYCWYFWNRSYSKYRYVMNLHHGAASQTADPMLVASMSNWTSAHRLRWYLLHSAHYGYDKEGMWRGVPQLTVQVRGKKVFDPRDKLKHLALFLLMTFRQSSFMFS
jgi:fatty acid desaturase